MKPYVIAGMNLAVYTCTISIVASLWLTVFYEAAYTRDTDRAGNAGNETTNEEWPMKMKLTIRNLVCTAPSPNLELTDDQLNEAWHLPPKTRLSPIMHDVARCQLGVKWLREKKGLLVPDRQCFCVQLWWVVAVFSLAFVFFVVRSCGFFCGISLPAQDDMDNLEQLRARRFFAGFWSMVWYAAVSVYGLRNIDAGVTYTFYGDMTPRAYYTNEPIHWFVIFALSMVISVLEGIKFVLYCGAVRQIKKRQLETAVRPAMSPRSTESSPPSYESLRLGTVKKSNSAV